MNNFFDNNNLMYSNMSFGCSLPSQTYIFNTVVNLWFGSLLYNVLHNSNYALRIIILCCHNTDQYLKNSKYSHCVVYGGQGKFKVEQEHPGPKCT